MDKEELKKIIIKELDGYWPYCIPEHDQEALADNMLKKIPDDDFEIIASGNIELAPNGILIKNNKEIITLNRLEGKNIDIGIRQVRK